MFSIGVDYGTTSVRSLLIDTDSGDEICSAVYDYPCGVMTNPTDPLVARQHPNDYLVGLEVVVREVIESAKSKVSAFDVTQICALGVDTTGSTPMPVDSSGTPLALLPEFAQNENAMVWLWKDHTSFQEAEEITEHARRIRPHFMAKCGGAYSSEWFWSKILHLCRVDRKVFDAAFSFVEHCDWIPAVLSGNTDPLLLKRSICAAGHKAMYNEEWGGLPDKEFLSLLDPALAQLRDRLYSVAYTSDTQAGVLCEAWAARLGLRAGISVSVGGIDAHIAAIGCGIREGTMVKIMGTSTCDLMIAPLSPPLGDIPGVCGVVPGSVAPGHYGIEAGQSAVGDVLQWVVTQLVPDRYGATTGDKFATIERLMAAGRPGQSGLLALDWNNGNRNVLADARLTGLLVGQTLQTEAHEVYRAYVEATAFGARVIIEQVEAHGVAVRAIVATGGVSGKSEATMQIYADVIGRPISVFPADQTSALGAAVCAAAAAGAAALRELQDRVGAAAGRARGGARVFSPRAEARGVYEELFVLYRDMHDAMGAGAAGRLDHVMKRLIQIRAAAAQRAAAAAPPPPG